MKKREKQENVQPETVEGTEEKVTIRHTISAEETFTLAKDVFDLRCFIKNVYSNRAVISRRLNILTLATTAIFTLIYAAYVLFTSFYKKLSLEINIVLYVLLGVYAVLFIAFFIVIICGRNVKARNAKRLKRVLAIFKLFVRLVSVAISIYAIVASMSGGEMAASHMAIDIVIIVISIIMLIVQIIPMLCGGIGKIVRWLLSPVKHKFRFSVVVLEWYELAASGSAKGSAKKVDSRYFNDIGTLIDNYLLPALGKKYITSIKSTQLLTVVDRADEGDKPILEGILKSVFAYAVECGYVTFDPCKDLNFEGSIEEEEKPEKPTVKKKLFNFGKKIGKSVLEKYINSVSEDEKK